jgi:hypothetical protein
MRKRETAKTGYRICGGKEKIFQVSSRHDDSTQQQQQLQQPKRKMHSVM